MRKPSAAPPQQVDGDRARDDERGERRRTPAARGEHLVSEEGDRRVRDGGPRCRPPAGKRDGPDGERRRHERRDEQGIEEGFPRHRCDVVEVEREDAYRTEIAEREEAQKTSQPVIGREHTRGGRGKPTK